MKINLEVAEFVGALLGDGCLSKYWSNSENCWRFEIAFTGSNSDFDYYNKFIQPTVLKNFGLRGRLFVRKDNSTRYHIRSRRLFEQLHDFGIPSGVKGRSLKIPASILSDNNLAIACVRGIWNTDGSIFKRYNSVCKNHSRLYGDYLVMGLKMFSKKLLTQVSAVLNANGIKTTRVFPSENCFVLKICDQKAIRKYVELIGFSNNQHIERMNSFLKTPLV